MVCVISESAYHKLPEVPKLKATNVVLNSVCGNLKCLGTFTHKVVHNDTCYAVKFYVIAGASNNLLSRQVVLYMDDILVYGSCKEEHDKGLRKVLETQAAGLKLNKEKCVWQGQSRLPTTYHRFEWSQSLLVKDTGEF